MPRQHTPIKWGSELLVPFDRARVTLFKCHGCRQWYVTRGRSKTCSDACRQRVYRQRALGFNP